MTVCVAVAAMAMIVPVSANAATDDNSRKHPAQSAFAVTPWMTMAITPAMDPLDKSAIRYQHRCCSGPTARQGAGSGGVCGGRRQRDQKADESRCCKCCETHCCGLRFLLVNRFCHASGIADVRFNTVSTQCFIQLFSPAGPSVHATTGGKGIPPLTLLFRRLRTPEMRGDGTEHIFTHDCRQNAAAAPNLERMGAVIDN